MSGAVFLFGKDLRLTDNYGLNNALKENEQILPLYEKRKLEKNNKTSTVKSDTKNSGQ